MRKLFDFLVFYGSLSVALTWLLQALLAIILNGNFFVYVRVWLLLAFSNPVHALTVTLLSTTFILNLYVTRWVTPPVWRVALSLAATTLGITVYDLAWVIMDSIMYKPVFFLPQVALTFTAVSINYMLNLQFRHVNVKAAPYVATHLVVFAFLMACLGLSGFYGEYHLYEQGLAADPHNVLWFMGKFSAFHLGTLMLTRKPQRFSGLSLAFLGVLFFFTPLPYRQTYGIIFLVVGLRLAISTLKREGGKSLCGSCN